jgi:hypothetical protein
LTEENVIIGGLTVRKTTAREIEEG